MQIGILGSGDVGQTLAAGFAKHGHTVTIGTRDPSKLQHWASQQKNIRVADFAATAKGAEVIVLAVKGNAASAALKGAGDISGKIVIDATNPIADAPPINGVLKFYTTLDDSQMERLQREFPKARFVKAFNSVGAGKMVNPQYNQGRPTMFICGNDAAAKKIVTQILDQFGWETADMGGVEAARAIEPLCMLWVIRGLRENKFDHAFKLLIS
jgi:predicted dinucleotide-binding enzyme